MKVAILAGGAGTICRSVNQGWMRGGYVGVLFIL
ncbi:MAG: hypothetical protein ACI8P0_003047, partial [Planctomycetaceae bacterium]